MPPSRPPSRPPDAAPSPLLGYALLLLFAPLAFLAQALLCLPWALLGSLGLSPLDED